MPSSNTPSGLANERQNSTSDIPINSEVTLEISSPSILLNENLLGQLWNVVDFRILNSLIPEDCLTKTDQDFLAFVSLAGQNLIFSSTDNNKGSINTANNTYKLRWSVNPEIVEIERAADVNESSNLNWETKFGDFVGSSGQAKKSEMESRMAKINFIQSKRLLLTHKEVLQLETSLSKKKSLKVYLGARVTDESLPSGKGGKAAPKGGAAIEKQNKLKSLGTVEVDLRGLLYPGRSEIFASYSVKADKSDSSPKSELNNQNANEQIKSYPSGTDQKTASAEEGQVAQGMHAQDLDDTASIITSLPTDKLNQNFGYTKSDDSIKINEGLLTLDIKMHRPILPARKIENTIEKISEMIPERGQWPRIERGSKHAVLFLKGEFKKLAEFGLEKILVRVFFEIFLSIFFKFY